MSTYCDCSNNPEMRENDTKNRNKEKRMTKAVIYCRTATLDEVDGPNSMEAQVEKCRNKCKENNWRIINTFICVGSSQITDEEGGPCQEILERMNGRKFDVLVVINADRLSRNLSLLMAQQKELSKNGIELVTVQQPTADFDIESIVAKLNKCEKKMITDRRLRGKQARKMRREKPSLPFDAQAS